MQPGIMITNGGPHPADKWAAMTASHIAALIAIDEASTSQAAVAARKAKPRFELALGDVLEVFHGNVQKRERDLLAAHGDAQLVRPIDPNDGVIDTPTEVAEAIAKAAADTPFAAHFALAEVKAVVAHIVDDHFGKVIDIERSWHADRHPASAAAQAYAVVRREHGPRNAHRHMPAHA